MLTDFEDIVGDDLFKVLPTTPEEAKGYRPPAKVALALVYLTKRKADPTFTLDDARNVRLSEVAFALDPTEAAASDGSRPSATSGT